MGWKNYELITFGCSHTYGTGLPDCWNGKSHGPIPSKFAWPAKLKENVNFKSVNNRSLPGSSNKMIAKEIIEYPNYTKQSVVVVLWSNFSRVTIYENENDRMHMLTHMIKKSHINKFPKVWWQWHSNGDVDDFKRKIKTYYEDFYQEFDAIFDQMIRMNYIHAFLSNKGIKNFHLLSEHSFGEHKSYFNKFMIDTIKCKTFNWKDDFHIDDAADKPQPHPGLLSHSTFATKIKDWYFK